MDNNTVVLFACFGMGDASQVLQHTLVSKFLSLWIESKQPLAKILLYTRRCQTGLHWLSCLRTTQDSAKFRHRIDSL